MNKGLRKLYGNCYWITEKHNTKQFQAMIISGMCHILRNGRRSLVNGIPGSKSTIALAAYIAMEYLGVAIANIGDRVGFTWSPKTRKFYNVKIKQQAIDLFWELVAGSRNFRPDVPIYLIAVTCNTDISVNATLRWAYEILTLITNQPLFGYWINKAGKRHLDAVLPAQFICESDAIKMAKKYEQDYIVRIRPNGKYATIKIR